MRAYSLLLSALLCTLALGGCGDKTSSANRPAPQPHSASSAAPDNSQSASEAAWQAGLALWQACAAQVNALNSAIAAMLQNPDAEHLAATQKSWRKAHQLLAQTQVLVTLGREKPGLFGDFASYWNNIDAQPIAPGYLDSIDGYPYSGIVNDVTLRLSAQNLRRQNGLTATNEATLGFHAMEFLLWGQHGERRATDFVAVKPPQAKGELPAAEHANNRRRTLLRLQGRLLMDDVHTLISQWRSPNGALGQIYYRLPAASRIQLWRQVITATLNKLQHSTTEPHCAFASSGCPPYRPALVGLKHLLENGGQHSLLAALFNAHQQAAWQKQYRALIALTANNASQRPQINTQLAALAALFRSQTPGQIPPLNSSSQQ